MHLPSLYVFEKNETFPNHSEPILKCVYSLPVTFEKLNQAISKQFVSDCYTGQATKQKPRMQRLKLGILIRCKFENTIFIYGVVPSTHQIKFPTILEQFSNSYSFRNFEQGHCPEQ